MATNCYWFRCEDAAQVRMQAFDIETGNLCEGEAFNVFYCYLHGAEAFAQGHLYNLANEDERRKASVQALQCDSDALPYDPDNGFGPYVPDPLTRCKFCHHERNGHIIGGGCHVEPREGYVCACRTFKE